MPKRRSVRICSASRRWWKRVSRLNVVLFPVIGRRLEQPRRLIEQPPTPDHRDLRASTRTLTPIEQRPRLEDEIRGGGGHDLGRLYVPLIVRARNPSVTSA